MKLSVIIPVHNGGENLRRCLDALAASTRPPDEVIVVDDASTDGSGDLARQSGAQARSVRLDGPPHGPAHARNRGAEAATGDVLVFLDADVAAHPDTLARIERTLDTPPSPPLEAPPSPPLEGGIEGGVAALFGSYDDDPPTPGLAARYKNLLHHYVHQHSRREAGTFWTGCGAIRRDVFVALGGFDESYRMIEDIELGVRLRRAGYRVWLCPDIQVTHLKRWTFVGLLRSDIFDRAVPWTKLMLRERHVPADLNVDARGRLGALAAWGLVVCLVLGCGWPLFWAGALLALVALVALNAELYRFFARRGGLRFAVGAAGLHTLYLLYSSLVFAVIAGPAWCARHGLALLLLATLLKGLAWSVVVPPWHAPDEQQHFLYGQSVERSQTLRVVPSLWVPLEARQLFMLIQFSAVRYGGQPLDLTDRADIAAQIAALNDPANQWAAVYDQGRQLIKIRNFTVFHPPLYYMALAAVQWPLEGTSILVRLLACRWLSVVLGLATVALAYGAGRELWPSRPGRALSLATLVSFQPMLTFCTAIVNNEALEITLFSACLLFSLQAIRRGLNGARGLTLGALTGLGLLTKISFLSILPLMGLLFARDALLGWRRRAGWQALGSWIWVALVPALLAGWWYAEAVLSGGDTLIQSFTARPNRPAVDLLPYLLHYGWLTIYRPLLYTYWGDFGWLDTPLPGSLWTLLEWATVIAAWTTGWWLVRRFVTRHACAKENTPAFAVFFLGCATLAVITFYIYLDFRSMRDLGQPFGIQGRYYLSPIIGQMVWLGIGFVAPVPARLRRVWMGLVGAGIIALNLYALFGVIAPRYYGPGDLLTLLERATVLQPMNPAALLTLCAGFAALTLALVAALLADPNTNARRR